MDERTVAAYDRGVGAYVDKRRAYHPDRAEAFAALLVPGARRLDLGSGPGHYLPHLGRPVVAADAAPGMVRQAVARHDGPGLSGVVCDIEDLPFARHAFDGVWASKSLQHVPAERLPMALAWLHRALAVGGVLDLTVFTGDGSVVRPPGDDFPGRLFSWWRPEALGHVLTGAGFDVESIEVDDPQASGGHSRMAARARRARTLADTVGPGMRLLVCGLNPSIYAADVGVGFARRNNRFWTAAQAAGLVVAAADRDPPAALRRHGVGMTDIVKRATVAAAELTADEYRTGLDRVGHLVGWLRPRAVCFVGLAGWRAAVDRRAAAGVQPEGLAGVPVYVMPSTSGLNARVPVTELAAHLRAAASLADRRPGAGTAGSSTLRG